MPVAVLLLQIHLPASASLKDRRRVVRGLKDRLRAKFNLSVAELDDEPGLWQRATVGLAAIGPDRAFLHAMLAKAADLALDILGGQEVILGDLEFLD